MYETEKELVMAVKALAELSQEDYCKLKASLSYTAKNMFLKKERKGVWEII